jgi:hypothetical protein
MLKRLERQIMYKSLGGRKPKNLEDNQREEENQRI